MILAFSLVTAVRDYTVTGELARVTMVADALTIVTARKVGLVKTEPATKLRFLSTYVVMASR